MSDTTLTYQVFVAPIIAIAGKDVPPGQSRSTWSPISATLISGRHDAVLVDPLMTVEQGMAVADWVSTTGKNLGASRQPTGRLPAHRRGSPGSAGQVTGRYSHSHESGICAPYQSLQRQSNDRPVIRAKSASALRSGTYGLVHVPYQAA
jgi:hypothetical protein